MKLLYIAFAQSIHTIKWVDYFKQDNEIMIISFYPADPIVGVDLKYLPVTSGNIPSTKSIKRLIVLFLGNPGLILFNVVGDYS